MLDESLLLVLLFAEWANSLIHLEHSSVLDSLLVVDVDNCKGHNSCLQETTTTTKIYDDDSAHPARHGIRLMANQKLKNKKMKMMTRQASGS